MMGLLNRGDEGKAACDLYTVLVLRRVDLRDFGRVP